MTELEKYLYQKSMKFLNPYIEIHWPDDHLTRNQYYTDIQHTIWSFCKNLDNKSGLPYCRLTIELSEHITERRVFINRAGKIIEIGGHISQLENKNEAERRMQFLKWIHNAFQVMHQYRPINIDKINNAILDSIQENITFHFESRPVLSRNRRYQGSFRLCLENHDKVIITLVICEKETGKTSELEILQTNTRNLSWFKVFNKGCKWIYPNTFGFSLHNDYVILGARIIDNNIQPHVENVLPLGYEHFFDSLAYKPMKDL